MPDYKIRIVADPTGARPGRAQVDKELGKLENRANAVRATLGRLFAVAGGTAVITRAIGTFARFEQTMATVQAVSRATEGEFALLREEAKRLGATTRFSATQAAEGAELLSRAGFTAAQTLGTLEGTLRLAQAGGLGLAQAADITTAVLKGFQLEVDQTGRVVDVLAEAAATANTTVAQLGDAVKFVAPIAAGLGVDLETTTAAIQALSNAGLQASLAGTGFRRVLAELAAPGQQLKSVLDAAGIAISDIDPRANKLADILRRLRQAGLDAGSGIEVFGQRGGPAFAVLQNAIPDIERFEQQLRASQGAAEEMARIMDANLNGALLAVKSAFEAVIISLGESQDETLTNFFRGLAGVLRSLAANADLLANSFEALAAVIAIKLVRGAINLLIARLKALRLLILTNPLGALISGLTLATALVIGFADEIKVGGDEFTTMRDFGIAALEGLKEAWGEAKIVIDAFFMGLRQTAKDVFGTDIGGNLRELLINVGRTFDAILGIAHGTFNALRELFLNNTTKIGASFELVFGSIKRQGEIAFKLLANVIATVFQDPVAGVAKSFLTLVSALGGVVAVARTIGLISEETRISFEDSVTALEALAIKKIGPIADVDLPFSKADIKQLEEERDRFIRESTAKINAAREESVQDLAARLKVAFAEGFTSTIFLEQFIRKSFARADEIAAEREAAARAAAAKREAAAAAGAEAPRGGVGAQEQAAALSETARELLKRIDINTDILAQEAALNELLAQQSSLQDQVNATFEASGSQILGTATDIREQLQRAFEELQLAALDASTNIGDGFTRAFIRIQQEARDFASVAEGTVYSFVDNSSNALADLVTTGKFEFNDLATSIIADLTEIYTRMLLIQAISFASGQLGLGAAPFGGFRQHGGPVTAGRSYIVGERGEERFTPGRDGRVDPITNVDVPVKVVNLQDPEEIAAQLNTSAGERVILNTIRKNRGKVGRILP